MAIEEETTLLHFTVDQGAAEKQLEKVERLLLDNKAAAQELTKAYKAGTITQEEYVKENIRLQQNTKKEQEQKKTLVKLLDAESNSIAALTEQNKQLRKERNNLDTTTERGIKKLNELNAAIDKNDKAIQKNVSAFEKQKLNIGNYASALDAVLPGSEKLVGSITGLTSSLGGTIGAIQKTGLSLQTLNAVPIVALIGSLVSVFSLLRSQMEENIKGLSDTYDFFQKLAISVEQLTKNTNNYVDSLKAENELLAALGGREQDILENERRQQLANIALQKEKIDLVKEEIKVLLDKRPFDQRSEEELRKQVSLALLLREQGKTQEQFLKSKKEELETEQKILTALQNQNTVLGVRATNQRAADELEAQKKADEAFKKALDDRIKFLQAQNQAELEERKRQAQDEADLAAVNGVNEQAQEQAFHDQTIQRLNDEAAAFLGLQNFKQEKTLETTKVLINADQALLRSAEIVFNSLAGLAEEGSVAQKALALTAIGIDTAQALTGGIAAAQDVPYPGNLVAMASVIATILGNIAAAKQYIDGFEEGGYTGPGRDNQAAGIVHANEYVTPAHVVRSPAAQPHLHALESMRMRGYQDGGFVTNQSTAPVQQALIMANALKNLPPSILDVRQVTSAQKQILVKEAVSTLGR